MSWVGVQRLAQEEQIQIGNTFRTLDAADLVYRPREGYQRWLVVRTKLVPKQRSHVLNQLAS